MKRIFISSVQKEFERERAAIKRMVEADPMDRLLIRDLVRGNSSGETEGCDFISLIQT